MNSTAEAEAPIRRGPYGGKDAGGHLNLEASQRDFKEWRNCRRKGSGDGVGHLIALSEQTGT